MRPAELNPSELDPALWTVLIAAAGRGTRLGFDKPKILFPVAGITILDRLVTLFRPLCNEFVFVLSPDGAPLVEPYLPACSRVAIQQVPRGMGDAVSCGVSALRTENAVIVWGDQFALKPASLQTCMRLLESSVSAQAVCPTLLRAKPYIHFTRDPLSMRLVSVLQQREGDMLPAVGESDSGVFFFRTRALQRYLPKLIESPACIGRQTKEQNFLPIFPIIDSERGALLMPRIMTEAESVGINSREDAAYLEARADL